MCITSTNTMASACVTSGGCSSWASGPRLFLELWQVPWQTTGVYVCGGGVGEGVFVYVPALLLAGLVRNLPSLELADSLSPTEYA